MPVSDLLARQAKQVVVATTQRRPPEERRGGLRTTIARRSRLPASLIVLSAATGVLVIAAAFTAGRLGYADSPWADRAYWFGQALIVVPIAVRVFVLSTISETEMVTLIVVLTIAEYMGKVCYSPTALTYVDELEHIRTVDNLMHTGKLFTVNYLLPISPRYPGLEELTSALASVTGLPLYLCALIVAGVAHLLFILFLYLIFRHVSRSYRIAGMAMFFYSSNPDLPSFDSMFAYQTLAEAFLGLAMLATWRLTVPGHAKQRKAWLAVALLAIMAIVITHHVTSYILVSALVLITFASLIMGDRRGVAWSATLALFAGVAVACWVIFAARGTVSYLSPVAQDVSQGIHSVVSGKHSSAPSTSAGPSGNRLLGAAGVLAISALIPIGVLKVWRRRNNRTWMVALAIGSLSWYAVVVVRLKIPDGSELSGRASTFVYIPVALILAVAVAQLVSRGLRWQASAIAAAAIIGALVVMFDGLSNGWPPYWERLPGAYQVGGVERAVNPEGIAAAKWALDSLGPGNRFAADFGNYPTLGSYGYQNPVYQDAYLYLSPAYKRSDARLVQDQDIGYVLVDLRLSQALPVSGQYFIGFDPKAGQYKRPLALTGLTKFNHVPGVSRIYDSGSIVIYDLKGSKYYAP